MNGNTTLNNISSFDTAPKGYEMRTLVNRFAAIMSALSLVTIVFALAGCGGGGSSAGKVSTEVVSGTADVGTPLTGKVSLKDSSSPALERTTTIGSDGTYAIDVTGMKAPFVLQATGSANGTDYKLQSFAEDVGTANINPLSNVIVASAAGDDDPEDSFDKSDSEKNHRIKTNLSKTINLLLTKLQPLLSQYSAEHTNPITARYITNHINLDDMFEHVKITVSNGILSIVNTKTRAVVFSGTVNDIANGIFDDSAVPPATTAPAAPAGLSAAGGTGEVTLTWSAVSNATSYNVYYATSTGVSKTTGTKIASVSTPYVHTGLTSGTTYYYVVTAVNSAGESSASPQKSATTASSPPVATVPAAPGSVSAAGGTKQVTLTWKAVNSATSYNIYYAQASGVTTATGTKIANVASPAVQTGLADSTTYFYIVTAVNSIGESAASAETSATTSATAPATCVACHAVPPASGAHTYHVKTKGYSCDKCHGAGYSSSAATAATHRNGVTDLSSSSGWDSSSQSCSNSCHGKKNW